MINLRNEQTFPVDIKKLKAQARTLLGVLDYASFDLGILLATPEDIHLYNRDYRQHDKPTDILSFPYHTLVAGQRIQVMTSEDKNLGDIIICPQYVHDDLERWQQTFEERMKVLLVHGICHLLGYDHELDEDYAVMKAQEEFLLSKL